jgi:hypothetical protein
MGLLFTLLLISPWVPANAAEEAARIVTRDGIVLGGIWALPSGAPRGAVLILQGSGNVGADGDVSSPMLGTGAGGLPARLSEQLANALAARGFASLRYAKRGFENPAELERQTIPYLLGDAESAYEQLAARFPAVRKGIAGFSEGALLAVMAAATVRVDALFLLALPSRPVDEILGYQFVQWPVDLLRRRLDSDSDSRLTQGEMARLGESGLLPPLGLPWSSADFDKDGSLELASELIPFYRHLHGQMMELTRTPAYAGWYASMKALPPFAQLAARVEARSYLYQATDDAQIDWSWIVSDSRELRSVAGLRFFSGLGHAFSPMEGAIGERKTTGPFGPGLIEQFNADVEEAFRDF